MMERAVVLLSGGLDSQSCVLPWDKLELASAANAEHPQVGSKIDAAGNLRVEELLVGNRHLTWPSRLKLRSEFQVVSELGAAVLDCGKI